MTDPALSAPNHSSVRREAVIQADRDAAASIMPFEGIFETLEWDGVVYAKAGVLRGAGDDHPTVQAFKSYRLALLPSVPAGVLEDGLEAAAQSIWEKRWFSVPLEWSPGEQLIETDEPRRFAEQALAALASPSPSTEDGK